MNDIKFRALDKEKKVFVKGMLCFGYDDFEWVLLNDNYEQILWNYNGELQQYTGLLDKNGIEIYEGDVVRNKVYIEGNKHVEYHNGSFGYKILIDNSFVWYAFCENTYFLSDIEVIGNIYESKELLEGF